MIRVVEKLNNCRDSIFADLKPKTYKEGRVCKYPGCKTKISIYRDSEACSSHIIPYCELLEKKYLKGRDVSYRGEAKADLKLRMIWDKRVCHV